MKGGSAKGEWGHRSRWNLPRGIYYDPKYCLPKKFQDCHKNEDCNSWAGAYFGAGRGYKFDKKAIDIYDLVRLVNIIILGKDVTQPGRRRGMLFNWNSVT